MATHRDADLLILGAGPAGWSAAFRAARAGRQVLLVDRNERPGGTAVHHGALPSKALRHAGSIAIAAREASALGLDFAPPRLDPARLMAWRRKLADDLASGIEAEADRLGVQRLIGRASFLTADRVEVFGAETTTLAFRDVILATGSRPVLAREWRIPGLVVDSTALLADERPPARLLVVGGGYIGLELAEIYSALGSAVQVVQVAEGVLPGADRDLAEVVERRLRRLVAGVDLATTVSSLRREGETVAATFASPVALPGPFDRVLVALGRRPNTDGLGLERTGVILDERGCLRHAADGSTDQPHLFVAGDAAGAPMLAHKAAWEGAVAADTACGTAAAADAQALPAVVYTDPELAWCGLTEYAAQQQQIAVRVLRCPWSRSLRARALGETEGLTKLVCDPASGRILGVGLVGNGAGELISEGVIAVEMAANAIDLARSLHPHPSLSETLALAAEEWTTAV